MSLWDKAWKLELVLLKQLKIIWAAASATLSALTVCTGVCTKSVFSAYLPQLKIQKTLLCSPSYTISNQRGKKKPQQTILMRFQSVNMHSKLNWEDSYAKSISWAMSANGLSYLYFKVLGWYFTRNGSESLEFWSIKQSWFAYIALWNLKFQLLSE